MGLAHNARLTRAVMRDMVVTYDDVELTTDHDVVKLRQDMEAQFGSGNCSARPPSS
jgi:predicted homoserine dehydrogenase-like protein